MHDVLSDPRRRAVLYYLREFENPADVDDLVDRILAWCPDGNSSDGTPSDSTRARLLNDHVRRMEAFGLLAYDPDRETVRLSEDVSVTVAPPREIGDETPP